MRAITRGLNGHLQALVRRRAALTGAIKGIPVAAPPATPLVGDLAWVNARTPVAS
jgi:hypothetical protein